MFTRLATASGVVALLAFPAFADCSDELTTLEQSVVSAETGAGGMPATEHQQEVLSGKQQGVDPGTTGSTAGKVEATSPHQEQVTGERTGQSAEHLSQLMADARKMAAAGDEQGCMKKAAEIKDQLGVK